METELTITTPQDLISQAIDKGLGVAELEKLLDLQERWEATKARKAFFEAFTRFQSDCPDIRKTKEVQAGQAKYHYAPLADIARQLNKVLKENDLSYRWEITDDKDTIKVTCLVSHIDGHTERTTMTSGPDVGTARNAIQARGSAIEYLKRYTLIGALGISTADSDIDGRMGEYEYDVDRLHRTFMEVYNQIIQIDPTYTRINPDNWLIERTGKNYVKAIGEARKKLFELQKQKS